mgnify:CR=1 FL=1
MIKIRKLRSVEEIEQCEKLPVLHKLWGTEEEIICYGQMGYIPEKEWIVKLTACESEPLATYVQADAPVYKDSALEVFLNFVPEMERYLNLEVNANGALLCQFGKRGDRAPVSSRCSQNVSVEVCKTVDKWSVLLRIPFELIRACFGEVCLHKGMQMSFNLYKICETEENKHFISYTFIPVPKPDFHLPQYFATGIMG